MKTRSYQIKEVADLAGVSTRTLRHYDEIGLLAPSQRSAAGYRLYTDADLLRLQQIMIGRSLGFSLEDIRASIDDPARDRRSQLTGQRQALVDRAEATAKMIRAIDAAISLLDDSSTTETGIMNAKQLFDGFDPEQYEAETRQRWGDTDSYKESARRTRTYRDADWKKIKEESGAIMNDAISLLAKQASPESTEAMEIAERYRLWVDRWFYPCDRSMHVNLGGMYETDARFAKYFEDQAAGLSSFIAAAVRANAQRRREG